MGNKKSITNVNTITYWCLSSVYRTCSLKDTARFQQTPFGLTRMTIICYHFLGFVTLTHTLLLITLWVKRCINIFLIAVLVGDRLCGLVVRVSGYRSRGPGFDSRPYEIWNGVHSASWSQLRSYLKKKVAAPSRKPRLTAVGIRCADHITPSTRKSRHYFADSGGRSVSIVRLRTKATEFSF
jgi:hypothetical protein